MLVFSFEILGEIGYRTGICSIATTEPSVRHPVRWGSNSILNLQAYEKFHSAGESEEVGFLRLETLLLA